MVINLHESRESLEQRLRIFKEKLKTEKPCYKKIDKDISSLLLEIELSITKLKAIVSLLTVEDYIKNMVIGNRHIALFGKKIQSRTLLIGITAQNYPIPPYIFLNISSGPLIFPYKPKFEAHDNKSKKTQSTTQKSAIQKRRF